MTEATWGRRETLAWPPHKPIYTLGALLLSFIAARFFVYLRFHFALSPLEQFYLPTYIKSDIAIVPSRSRFQMPFVSDARGRAWYAREEDVEGGSTPLSECKADRIGNVRLCTTSGHGSSLSRRTVIDSAQ